jgi:hypothetical protein
VPVVGILLGGTVQFIESNVEWNTVIAMLATFWLASSILGLYSAMMFRGGLVLQLLGIAVVSRGAEASRPRVAARACIAWSPAALFGLGVATGIGVLQMLALSMLLVGVVWALARPERGLQDIIADTYLVVH